MSQVEVNTLYLTNNAVIVHHWRQRDLDNLSVIKQTQTSHHEGSMTLVTL